MKTTIVLFFLAIFSVSADAETVLEPSTQLFVDLYIEQQARAGEDVAYRMADMACTAALLGRKNNVPFDTHDRFEDDGLIVYFQVYEDESKNVCIMVKLATTSPQNTNLWAVAGSISAVESLIRASGNHIVGRDKTSKIWTAKPNS